MDVVDDSPGVVSLPLGVLVSLYERSLSGAAAEDGRVIRVAAVKRHAAIIRRSLLLATTGPCGADAAEEASSPGAATTTTTVTTATTTTMPKVEMSGDTAAALSRVLVTAIAKHESGSPVCLDALEIVTLASRYAHFRGAFTMQEGAALLSTRVTAGTARAVQQWRASMFGDAAQQFHVSALCFAACHALLREASEARESPNNLQPQLHGTIVAAFTLLAAAEEEEDEEEDEEEREEEEEQETRRNDEGEKGEGERRRPRWRRRGRGPGGPTFGSGAGRAATREAASFLACWRLVVGEGELHLDALTAGAGSRRRRSSSRANGGGGGGAVGEGFDWRSR